ncbi:damage-inducible protein CinA [Leucothrix pacifica]|uniref:Damage-inducible protein CinA n=2 Tax=Leucothrix pacifica TaxID=1247513 RepID=A0A317CQY4_9GAMM|nr:damage-inducible protein CinA [Leucothrix pacifica]
MRRMNESELIQIAEQVSNVLRAHKQRLATVESCTGGWVAKLLTDLSGSSDVLDCGFVTYSNGAKQKMVDVKLETLEQFGAVSKETAAEMASGALRYSDASVSLSITGVAGPGGGTDSKPVGMVCFGWANRQELVETDTCHFEGDRNDVRMQSVAHALQGVVSRLGK